MDRDTGRCAFARLGCALLIDEETRLAAEKTAERMLGFSKLFFGAFSVKREREKGWQFLHVVLQKQKHGRVLKKDIMQSAEFERLINHASDKNYALDEVLKCFNESRTFVAPIAGRTQVRAFELTDEFDQAVTNYIVTFFALFHPELVHQVDRMDVDALRDLMKEIFGFQYSHLYKAWTDQIEAVASLKATSREQQLAFAAELEDRAPYWAIMLICWRRYLLSPTTAFDIEDIDNEVKDAMLTSNPIEIVECFSFLASPKVGFLGPAAGKPRHYRFDESYAGVMLNYTNRLRELEGQLQAFAVASLRSVEERIQERLL